MMKPITKNTLFYGDNLKILHDYIPDQSIDLIYLDPPFNSNRNYNVIFKDESGYDSEAQITAFEDTWHWDIKAQETYHELIADSHEHMGKMISALRDFMGTNQSTAYLIMMTVRLIELHRVLKSTGSLYLHCDPTMSHYLKIVLDAIFGRENFRNEIIWQRSNPKSHVTINFPNCTDTILRYTKTDNYTYHQLYMEHNIKYVDSAYKYYDEKGRYRLLPLLNPNKDRPHLTYEFLGITRVWRWTEERMYQAYKEGLVVQVKKGAVPQYKKYLDESKGRTVTNCWTDILQVSGNESLGYPTQKPIALLERVLNASSSEGDTILDPFCGCGTAIYAAEKLNRKWIGIDITHLSTSLLKYRLKDAFNLTDRKDYDVVGEPEDVAGAERLAQENRYQFQWWALSLVQAKPAGGVKKKGKDKGIDGVINFIDDNSEKLKQVIVQVKSGKTSSKDIRDLSGTVEHEKAQMGIFITLNKPSSDMRASAAEAGFYHSSAWNKNYPKIQIAEIEQLMNGQLPDLPPFKRTFKQAKKDIREQDKWKQGQIDDDLIY